MEASPSNANNDWDVRSLSSDLSLSLPSSPGPDSSPRLPESPMSLPSIAASSQFSLSPRSSHLLLPPSHGHFSSYDRGLDTSRTLVLPSLPWPHIPTQYGETLGELRLLVVSRRGAEEERGALRRALLDENGDVLRVYEGTVGEDGRRVTVADTALVGENGEEGARNLCLVETPGYDQRGQVTDVLQDILSAIYEPFRAVRSLLNPDQASTPGLVDLLASPGTHFFAACIFLLSPNITPLEYTLFRTLEATLPVLPLRSTSLPYDAASTFPLPLRTTYSSQELAHVLFRCPQKRERMCRDAAAGFLSWWSAERDSMPAGKETKSGAEGSERSGWGSDTPHSLAMPVLDPLHKSVLALPLTLLSPVVQRIMRHGLGCSRADRCKARAAGGHEPRQLQSCEGGAPDRRRTSHRSCDSDLPFGWKHLLLQGTFGFAAITVLWAGLVWVAPLGP